MHTYMHTYIACIYMYPNEFMHTVFFPFRCKIMVKVLKKKEIAKTKKESFWFEVILQDKNGDNIRAAAFDENIKSLTAFCNSFKWNKVCWN